MTQEQELAIQKIAESIDAALKTVVVGIEMQDSEKRRWYTPQAIVLKFLRIGSHVAPMEAQLVMGCLHGCVDLFGFSGTVKLALQLKRRIGNGRRNKKA